VRERTFLSLSDHQVSVAVETTTATATAADDSCCINDNNMKIKSLIFLQQTQKVIFHIF